MEPEEHLRTLESATAALLASAHGALDRPVAACPGWDVADVVVHMGQVWAWAAAVVGTGDRAEREPPPDDRSEEALLSWADARAARLLDALGAVEPDTGCWTFGEPRTARFWFRRQALETALHGWDVARAAAPSTAPPLVPEVAADGVDEHLRVLTPRWLRAHPGDWTGETLHLHRTDGDGEWLVRIGPTGAIDVAGSHGKGDVALRGDAAALWLWATNRAPIDELGIECFGDRSLPARWTAQMGF